MVEAQSKPSEECHISINNCVAVSETPLAKLRFLRSHLQNCLLFDQGDDVIGLCGCPRPQRLQQMWFVETFQSGLRIDHAHEWRDVAIVEGKDEAA